MHLGFDSICFFVGFFPPFIAEGFGIYSLYRFLGMRVFFL